MRRFVLAACLLVLTFGLASGVAVAAVDDDAVAGLKASPVYIAPGTEGTTPETAGQLLGQLRDDDRIVIVMLPGGALSDYQGGTSAFLAKLDRSTGGKYIFALSVGDQTIGYSTLLPSGVAADMMRRASSVSVNKIETLGTYARNVHSWQAQNPAHPASRPEPKPRPKPVPTSNDDGGSNLLLTFGAAAIALFIIVGVVVSIRHRSRTLGADYIRFRSPDIVKDRLERVIDLRSRIEDPDLRSLLLQIARDTEEYFQRNTAKKDADAVAFERHFAAIEKVISKYIDVQNNQRYFDEPYQLMRRGHEAVAGFGDFVLNSVKRGTRQDLIDFRVDTDILAAQKHA